MSFVARRGLPIVAGVFAVASIFFARDLAPDPFERLRLHVFDTLQRMAPWDDAGSRVRVIDIDDASLKRLGQWPWPRATIATLVRNLQAMQASAIAFDVVFAEPDRTSPALLLKAWEKSYGWTLRGVEGRTDGGKEDGKTAPRSLPDYDQDLAQAFAAGRVVAGFGLLPGNNGNAPTPGGSIATIGGDPSATLPNFQGAIPNLAALGDAAAGNGSFTITGGRDEVIRRMPLLMSFQGRVVPALSLEALRVALDEDTIGVRAEHNGGPADPVIGYTIRVGEETIPIDADGTLPLHHGFAEAGKTIPVWRVLEPDALRAIGPDIKNRIVLIGTSATGLVDLRATPLNPLEPGVDMHARALDQILAHHFLSRPPWAAGVELCAAFVLAIVLILVVTFIGLRTAAIVVATVVALPMGASWLLFTRSGLMLDPSLIALTAAASGICAGFARYLVAERDASKLRAAFMHYVSPELVKALARDPSRLKLGGELREMTFLFTDLEGFTHLTETIGPEKIVVLLNNYLEGLCRIAFDHGGTVDKIVGDALHVMFNAPLDQADHAERAVRCALAIDVFGQAFSQRHQALGLAFGVTRIGVNTGPAVVGNFGGGGRFDYTAHGDAINTAARLESANKALGTRICIARSTASRVRGIDFLPVGTLMLKGKSEGVDVFLPQSADGWRDIYIEAFDHWVQGEANAEAALLDLHARHPDEPILALHARRIRKGEHSVRMAA